MYTHLIETTYFCERFACLLPATFGTTADAVEIHLETSKRRLARAEIASFKITEIKTGNVVDAVDNTRAFQ